MNQKNIEKEITKKDGNKTMKKKITGKKLLDMFMEWYKTEMDYAYMLSDYMDMLDCGGWSDIKSYVGKFVAEEILNYSISDFTDYEDDSPESAIWEKAKVVDGDELWDKYEDAMWTFRDEFIETYR